jgi:hypothetical protein
VTSAAILDFRIFPEKSVEIIFSTEIHGQTIILFISTLAIGKMVKESLKVSKNRAAKIRKFRSSEVNIACSPT